MVTAPFESMPQMKTRANGDATSAERQQVWKSFIKLKSELWTKWQLYRTTLQNLHNIIHGTDVTLECATTEGFVPLSYCRFEPPNDIPLSIVSSVNYSSPILGRFYFPANKSLDRGDCAVTVREVKYADAGLWTCGAGLSDGKEYTDNVKLVVLGLYTMTTASATGVAFGALGVAAILTLGYLGWKRRCFNAMLIGPEIARQMEMPQVRRSPQW